MAPTNAELQEMVKDLKKENKRLAKENEIKIGGGVEKGYLIQTPNPEFSGITMHVPFSMGKAFVPLASGGEKFTAAQEKIMDLFENDFHYEVTLLDKKGIAKLRKEAPVVDGAVGQALHEQFQAKPIATG